MGKITFYCTICAGPLYNWELRKASMAQPGDNENLFFDDACECSDVSDSNEPDEENSEEALLKHAGYCSSRMGYWGDILSERDTAWLAKPRMLRMQEPVENDDRPGFSDDRSLCYLTSIGVYSAWEGFWISGADDGLWPNEDGFMVHDACWQLLQLVHKIMRPRQQPLDPSRVYQTMLTLLTYHNDTYLDWRDPRLYGGTEEFAMQEWEPVPGHEWLVSNPLKDIDFSDLVKKSTLVEPKAQHRNATSGPILADPFAKLPIEMHYMILKLLPSESVLSLFLSSRSFRGASTALPQAFWRSRIYTDTPWIEGTSLFETVFGLNEKVNYKTLLSLLKDASGSLPGGVNTRYETNLSLKNRRRIWRCCEGILDAVGRRIKE